MLQSWGQWDPYQIDLQAINQFLSIDQHHNNGFQMYIPESSMLLPVGSHSFDSRGLDASARLHNKSWSPHFANVNAHASLHTFFNPFARKFPRRNISNQL